MKLIACPHCGDTYPDFDVAHMCSRGPYAPQLKPRMNERIQKLKDQCWVEKRWDNDMWIEKHIDQEKFAELIVKECIWALWTEECRTSDLASEEYTRGSNKIKEHFGVEE